MEDEDCIGVTLRVEGDGSRQCDRRTGVVDTRNQCPTGQVGSRRLCGSLTGKSVVGSQHVGFRSLRYRVATMIGAGNRQVRYTGDGWRRIRADIAAEGCRSGVGDSCSGKDCKGLSGAESDSSRFRAGSAGRQDENATEKTEIVAIPEN